MSDVRVRLQLGALCGVWESLGIRLPWAQEIVSSNLTTPTVFPCHLMVRDRPVKPGMYVQLVPGELTGRASQMETATVSKTVERYCLGGSTPPPSALKNHVPLAERQRRQPSKLERRVQLPQGILGDRLTVGCLPLKQATEVRILLPEPFHRRRVSDC